MKHHFLNIIGAVFVHAESTQMFTLSTKIKKMSKIMIKR